MRDTAKAEICPLIPQRTKADCRAKCRGCATVDRGLGSEPADAKGAGAGAAVCPRVPQRMKYTCSGKCPDCRSRDEPPPAPEIPRRDA